MNRIRTRWFVLLVSLFAVSVLLATTAVAAPGSRPEAGPSNRKQPVVDKKAPPKRAPPARSAGSRRGQPKATGGKTARGRPAAPSPPRRTARPTRGIPPKRIASPPRRTPRPSAAPRTRSAPRPRTTPPTPPTRPAPRPKITPRTWERRQQPDVRTTPAPRRRRPNVNITPVVSKAPGGSGHGPKRRKPGHHHHRYCGCSPADWSRLLYGYFDSYGNRYGCDPYDYRYGARTTYVTFGTQLLFDGYGPLPCTATGPQAWALLADDQAAAAFLAFECLSQTVPDDGYLLVGLALAAAAIDEHDLAVTALRAAMRVDPVSLLDVPGGDRLDVLLSKTANYYDTRARAGYGDVDALFMVAALRYLLGQDAFAHYAIEIAITLDDDDPSTRNLKGLIEASPEDAELRRAR